MLVRCTRCRAGLWPIRCAPQGWRPARGHGGHGRAGRLVAAALAVGYRLGGRRSGRLAAVTGVTVLAVFFGLQHPPTVDVRVAVLAACAVTVRMFECRSGLRPDSVRLTPEDDLAALVRSKLAGAADRPLSAVDAALLRCLQGISMDFARAL
jgi:hypothetical protein